MFDVVAYHSKIHNLSTTHLSIQNTVNIKKFKFIFIFERRRSASYDYPSNLFPHPLDLRWLIVDVRVWYVNVCVNEWVNVCILGMVPV